MKLKSMILVISMVCLTSCSLVDQFFKANNPTGTVNITSPVFNHIETNLKGDLMHCEGNYTGDVNRVTIQYGSITEYEVYGVLSESGYQTFNWIFPYPTSDLSNGTHSFTIKAYYDSELLDSASQSFQFNRVQ